MSFLIDLILVTKAINSIALILASILIFQKFLYSKSKIMLLIILSLILMMVQNLVVVIPLLNNSFNLSIIGPMFTYSVVGTFVSIIIFFEFYSNSFSIRKTILITSIFVSLTTFFILSIISLVGSQPSS